jgi:hypothetical protein
LRTKDPKGNNIRDYSLRKTYHIDFIDSNEPILLGNRDTWQVLDEELEEIKNKKFERNLIKFCIKHFDDYQSAHDNAPLNAVLLERETSLISK